jgi:hypothetical protein
MTDDGFSSSRSSKIKENLEDALEDMDWARLKMTVMKTFDVPQELENKLWENMLGHDRLFIDEKEDKEDDTDGSSDNFSFCFDYLLNDSSAENFGWIYGVQRELLSEEEKTLLQKFHTHLRKIHSTFSSYWDHLKCMLPEILDGAETARMKNISKIWKVKK